MTKIVRNNMKSVALHNLGCKVNSYEIDFMQQMLQEKGYKIVAFDEQADIYIVNTCTVTNIADRKSRQMLHRAKKKNPDAIVVAVGCYVQTGKDSLEKDACIDLAIGNNKKKDLLVILESYLLEHSDKTLGETTVIDINHTKEYEEMTLTQTADHTRAYIKIQDGCNQFCSYCIIPYARGRVRSRKEEDILNEIKGLVSAGYQEVILTGIHISSYGIDFGQICLLELLKAIHEIEGLERIRLGSLEPGIITKEFVSNICKLSKICPHFHLSLQSGSDATLKRMNRRYDAGQYYEKVKLLREYYDEPAITTDVIVGFPGETEEEFIETREFLETICFYEMHIFKYSKRQGTKAASMENQISDSLKTQRSNILIQLGQVWARKFRNRLIGQEREVLFEEMKIMDGQRYMIGFTSEYVKVAKKTEEDFGNKIKKGLIKGFLTEEILEMQ